MTRIARTSDIATCRALRHSRFAPGNLLAMGRRQMA
jgi:hypothetical protein